MKPLKISKDLKYGVEEILLNPTEEGNKCGSTITALTLSSLFSGIDGKDTQTALQYIDEKIAEAIAKIPTPVVVAPNTVDNIPIVITYGL